MYECFRQASPDSASLHPVHPVNPVQENEKGEDAGLLPCPPLLFSSRCDAVRAPQAWRFLRFGAEAPDFSRLDGDAVSRCCTSIIPYSDLEFQGGDRLNNHHNSPLAFNHSACNATTRSSTCATSGASGSVEATCNVVNRASYSAANASSSSYCNSPFRTVNNHSRSGR